MHTQRSDVGKLFFLISVNSRQLTVVQSPDREGKHEIQENINCCLSGLSAVGSELGTWW